MIIGSIFLPHLFLKHHSQRLAACFRTSAGGGYRMALDKISTSPVLKNLLCHFRQLSDSRFLLCCLILSPSFLSPSPFLLHCFSLQVSLHFFQQKHLSASLLTPTHPCPRAHSLLPPSFSRYFLKQGNSFSKRNSRATWVKAFPYLFLLLLSKDSWLLESCNGI